MPHSACPCGRVYLTCHTLDVPYGGAMTTGVGADADRTVRTGSTRDTRMVRLTESEPMFRYAPLFGSNVAWVAV